MRAPMLKQLPGVAGHFRVWVLYNRAWIDVSQIRGVPTKIISYSSTDPFGPSTAEVEFPSLTTFDAPGQGDLKWMRDSVPLNITFTGDDDWVWEGNIASIEADDHIRVQCRGGLYVLDNDLAKPTYPTNPIPYETLMKRYCARQSGLAPMEIQFPSNWNVVYKGLDQPSYLWMLPPTGIAQGERWTGLATRSTGSWDRVLTGYIQGLLTNMYTPEGEQWGLTLAKGRVPTLKVRAQHYRAREDTYVVSNGTSGVSIRLSKDWNQSANVIYGAGTDLYGLTYSNMEMEGETTVYEPFAYHPLAYPKERGIERRETYLNFAPGVDKIAATGIAQNHYQTNADPGWVGTVTLEVDPRLANDVVVSRFTMTAGQTIMVKNWMGGHVLLHITQVQANPESGMVTINVDSRYRDVLTSSEVYARTRDALNPIYGIKIGRSSITINDLVKPWSYADGSGMVPYESRDLFGKFRDLDAGQFPWEEATRRFPPSKFSSYYVKLDRSRNLTRKGQFWSQPFRILLSQEGTIRLSQFGVYDRDGNIIPANFHFSVWDRFVQYTAMPMVPKGAATLKPAKELDYYPFFADAFLDTKRTGEMKDEPMSLMPRDAMNFVGWGTYEEPAGYYPGLYSQGNPATGMLVDETMWTFNTTSWAGAFDPTSKAKTAKNPDAGIVYGIVYCDELLDEYDDIYFLGRFFNVPSGNG